jgi:hypothetical protein
LTGSGFAANFNGKERKEENETLASGRLGYFGKGWSGKTSVSIRTVPAFQKWKYHCVNKVSGAGIPAIEAIRITSYYELTQGFINNIALEFGVLRLRDHIGACFRIAWNDRIGLALPWRGGIRPEVKIIPAAQILKEFPDFGELQTKKKFFLVFAVESRGVAALNGALWRLNGYFDGAIGVNRDGVGFMLKNHGPSSDNAGGTTISNLKATFAIAADEVQIVEWDGMGPQASSL